MAFSDTRRSKSLTRALRSLGATVSVTDFLNSVGTLAPADRERNIEQAIVVISQLYAHLPLKQSMHAIAPVQRLRLLRHRHSAMDAVAFHAEIIEIFKGLRDAHTNYGLPSPFRGRIVFLPFLMEDYFDGAERRFLATRVLFGLSHVTFKPGVQITHWNGMPIGRAVQRNADREEGSNPAARFSFGLAAMTIRSLGASLPPDEEWVIVEYRAGATTHEILFPWRVWNAADPQPDLSGSDGATLPREEMEALSVCLRVQSLHQARKRLFAPQAVQAEQRMAEAGRALHDQARAIGDLSLKGVRVPRADLSTESILPKVFQFAVYEHLGREFGYIRIRTFGHSPVSEFLNEFLRILALMPGDGLILDVRGNGGGIILNGELMLQFLTPKPITPEPFQFINSPLTREICSDAGPGVPAETAEWRHDLASQWGASIAESIETGAVFSKGVPLSDPDTCNALGQFYHGPVALITDAQCYSTTDIFAAGFQDHGIGPVIGIDPNTGAGGANVWEHGTHLVPLLPDNASPIAPLPTGTSMRVAIRRATRVGPNAGRILEDLGVVRNVPHQMTRNDLMNGNIDLITAAADVLATLPVRWLQVSVGNVTGGQISATAETRGIERLDCFIDGRPTLTQNVTDGNNPLIIPLVDGPPSVLDLRGYQAGELVAARKIRLS